MFTDNQNQNHQRNNMYIITRLHKANKVSCIDERDCTIDPLHPPTRIHWDLIKAKQEAARLAEKHPGLQFMIFQATDAVMCPVAPTQWLKL
jgi:hypothetical protein